MNEESDGELLIRDLLASLASLDSEVEQSRERQLMHKYEAEIAEVKRQIAGEYRVKFMDLRDKLRAKISKANVTAQTRTPNT